MPRIKLIVAVILALVMAFPAVSANAADAAEETPVQTAEETAPEPTPEPTATEPAATPEPTLEPSPTPEPVLSAAPEATAVPEPAAAVETTPAADPAAVQEAPATPQPEPETLLLPDIPAGAPAPAQIKRLEASGMACLTFDDGYSKASIEKILACLRSSGVRCTFFVIGACLKKYPGLWRQAVEDGNEIAYHTMTHGSLNRCSNAKIVRDINQWNDTARSVLGVGYRIPKFGRAPGGSANTRVRRLFNCLGYRLIYWSSDTYTGVYRGSKRNAAARIARYIVKRTTAGSISLQHFNKYDASSVSWYIAALKEKYTLGTISEALAASGSG